MEAIDYIKEAIIFSKFQFAKLRSSSGPIAESIYKDGFAMKKGGLSKDMVKEAVEIIDDLLKQDNVNVWSDEQGADRRIYEINKLNPRIEKLIPLEEAKKIGEDYLGTEFEDYFVMAGVIEHKNDNVGSGGGWHRDSPFSHQFKIIVYLTDVNEQNGPFQYFKRSHLSSSKMKVDFPLRKMRFTNEEVMKLPNDDLVEFHGGAGDVLYADVRGIHRGKPLISGVRKAITVYFFDNARAKESFHLYMQKKEV